jgi:hypothetical protein
MPDEMDEPAVEMTRPALALRARKDIVEAELQAADDDGKACDVRKVDLPSAPSPSLIEPPQTPKSQPPVKRG